MRKQIPLFFYDPNKFIFHCAHISILDHHFLAHTHTRVSTFSTTDHHFRISFVFSTTYSGGRFQKNMVFDHHSTTLQTPCPICCCNHKSCETTIESNIGLVFSDARQHPYHTFDNTIAQYLTSLFSDIWNNLFPTLKRPLSNVWQHPYPTFDNTFI